MKDLQQVRNSISNYSMLLKNDKKYSYMIIKPNGEKHFSEIVSAIRGHDFTIEGMYAINDYEYVNILLHPEKEKHKYIVSINRVYKDFYCNNAILILVSKENVSYRKLVMEIVNLKLEIRSKYDYNYIATILDISKIGMQYNGESVKIINMSQVEVAKQKMNEKGTYLIISINELHSPDASIENTINELKLLFDNKIIVEENRISTDIISKIEKYGTFSFLQDLNVPKELN